MREARLIRRRRFTASHHYYRSTWSRERNESVFGPQTRSHSHEWTVEVRVVGAIDVDTGFVADLGAIDRALDAVVGPWAGADLNVVVPAVATEMIMPSTESLAGHIYHEMESILGESTALEQVIVFESDDLGAEYPARIPAERLGPSPGSVPDSGEMAP